MVKNLLYLCLILLLCIGCNKEEEAILPQVIVPEYPDSSINFEFKAVDNSALLLEDIKLEAANNTISGLIPYLLKSDTLVASYTFPAGATVTVNEVPQVSGISKNDFSQPVVYDVKFANGVTKAYTVKLSTFTGIPILNITTEGNQEIVSKDVYVNGQLKINGNNLYTEGLYNGSIQIKGRGNSTWGMPKKPYKIKLPQKAPLFDLPADKEWVLLANYSDKTLMRNYFSLELSRWLGLAYTPRTKFVEVFINNEYQGNYLLTEQIKIAKDRVNIKELTSKDTDPAVITGGYLLEIDDRLDADTWFKTEKGVPFCIKSPENIAPAQLDYISKYVQQTEDAIYAANFADPAEGYAKYIDVNSFVNWYLLNEITKNTDAIFYTSVYMYKDRNGKLCLGPAWDYDISLGNVNYDNNDIPEGFYIKDALWINRLLQDPAFYNKVKTRFNLLKANELNNFAHYIQKTAAYLHRSQNQNFQKWQILETYVWPNAVVLGTYENEVNYLIEWLHKRLTWIDKEFNAQL